MTRRDVPDRRLGRAALHHTIRLLPFVALLVLAACGRAPEPTESTPQKTTKREPPPPPPKPKTDAELLAAAVELAARAAFDTDDEHLILERLASELQALRYVLPSAVRLEHIGLAGRARARRLSAQALNDALNETHKSALAELLRHDSALGQSRLTWLRALPHSTGAASLHGLLERLKFVRQLGLPADLSDNSHPAGLGKFTREGAIAPVISKEGVCECSETDSE